MHNRRRQRRKRYQKRNKPSVNFTPVIIMLCLSIGCGYAAAKYVVDPVVNYVPQLMTEKSRTVSKTANNNETNITKDETEITETGEITGYALQFGCYSSQSAAESVLPSIGVDGLQILKQNDMYKVVGKIYKTKEEAKTSLGNLPQTTKAFVTPIYD